jgi:hypothetical protein
MRGKDTKRTELHAKEYKSLIYKGPGLFTNWAMIAHFTHSSAIEDIKQMAAQQSALIRLITSGAGFLCNVCNPYLFLAEKSTAPPNPSNLLQTGTRH